MAYRSDDREDRGGDRDSRGGRGGFGRSGGSRFGGGRSSGGRSSFGGGSRGGGFGRDRRPVEMHDVICDKCKKECQVPFKPSGDKPVLCSDCFIACGEGGRGRSSGGGVSSEEIGKINAKLDKIIELLGALEVVDDSDEDAEEETK